MPVSLTSLHVTRALCAGVFAVAAAAPAIQAQQSPVPAVPRVRIINPDQGVVLVGRNVPVVLEVQGVELASALERGPGTAHIDLFLDRDLTPRDSVLADSAVGIVHLARGQLWYTYERLSLGPHRLTAVLVNSSHRPLKPLAADSVRFALTRKP